MLLSEFTIPNQIQLADGMAGQSRVFTVGVNAHRIEHDGFTVAIEVRGGRHDGKTLVLTPMGYGWAVKDVAVKSKPSKVTGAVQ